MHCHINDFEATLVAQFRKDIRPRVTLDIFGRRVVITRKRLNEIDARAAGCPRCNSLIENRKKFFIKMGDSPQPFSTQHLVRVNKEKARKFERGEISLDDILFTQDFYE